MADSAAEQRYAAQLRQQNRLPDLPSAGRFTRPSPYLDETLIEHSTELREQAYQEQLNADRFEAIQAAEAEEEEAIEDDAAAKSAQTKTSSSSAVDKALGQAQNRLRWWLWGFVIPSFGLMIFALDIIYLARGNSATFQRIFPEPKLWEVITLMVLTLLLTAVGLALLIIMLLPILLGAGVMGGFLSTVGVTS